MKYVPQITKNATFTNEFEREVVKKNERKATQRMRAARRGGKRNIWQEV